MESEIERDPDQRPWQIDFGITEELYQNDYPEYLRRYGEYRKAFFAWAKRTNYQEEDCGCS